MPLTDEDIERIEALGYRREEFSLMRGGMRVLRNIEGHCFFYEEGRGCRIYPYRPLGCSLYPVVYDVDSGKAVVDDYCPLAPLIPRRWLAEAEPLLRLIVTRIEIEKRDKGEA